MTIRVLATVVALLASTTMASAITRNPDQALALSVSLTYNDKCEALPSDYMMVVRFGRNTQSEEDLSSAEKIIQDIFNKDGLTAFCDRAKPIVAYGIDQVNKQIEKNRKFLKGEDK